LFHAQRHSNADAKRALSEAAKLHRRGRRCWRSAI
jgi:hypothetical protein